MLIIVGSKFATEHTVVAGTWGHVDWKLQTKFKTKMPYEAYSWEEMDSDDLKDPYQANISELHFLAISESFLGIQRHRKKRKKKN